MKYSFGLKHKVLLAAVLLSTAFVCPQSKSEDPQITIRSDSVKSTFDGITRLSGNIKLTQGPLQLTADELVVTRRATDDLEIRAAGSPVRFQQTEPEIVSASASTMSFRPNDHLIVLQGDVVLVQDTNTVRGDEVQYDIEAGEVLAQSSSGERQVEITLDIE